MREVITVELDLTDVQAAIEDMLLKHGYEIEKVKFKCEGFVSGIDLIGATATVTKITKGEEA